MLAEGDDNFLEKYLPEVPVENGNRESSQYFLKRQDTYIKDKINQRNILTRSNPKRQRTTDGVDNIIKLLNKERSKKKREENEASCREKRITAKKDYLQRFNDDLWGNAKRKQLFKPYKNEHTMQCLERRIDVLSSFIQNPAQNYVKIVDEIVIDND